MRWLCLGVHATSIASVRSHNLRLIACESESWPAQAPFYYPLDIWKVTVSLDKVDASFGFYGQIFAILFLFCSWPENFPGVVPRFCGVNLIGTSCSTLASFCVHWHCRVLSHSLDGSSFRPSQLGKPISS
jgi:hypothetical protein